MFAYYERYGFRGQWPHPDGVAGAETHLFGRVHHPGPAGHGMNGSRRVVSASRTLVADWTGRSTRLAVRGHHASVVNLVTESGDIISLAVNPQDRGPFHLQGTPETVAGSSGIPGLAADPGPYLDRGLPPDSPMAGSAASRQSVSTGRGFPAAFHAGPALGDGFARVPLAPGISCPEGKDRQFAAGLGCTFRPTP